MLHKLFTNSKTGAPRGILVAFLTGLIYPFFLEGINVYINLVTRHRLFFTFEEFLPIEMLVIYTGIIVDTFIAYIIPCIITGILLAYLSKKKVLSILVFVVCSGLSSFLILKFTILADFLPDNYLPITIALTTAFQYLCFFIWERSAV